jgi:uncharacterized surface protein with fasciclin (FAS1) repeats
MLGARKVQLHNHSGLLIDVSIKIAKYVFRPMAVNRFYPTLITMLIITPKLMHTRTAVARFSVIAVAALSLAACASSTPAPPTSAAATQEAIAQPSTQAEATPSTPSDSKPSTADTSIPVPPSTSDVFTTIAEDGKYPTFVKLVTDAGLAEALKTGGPFTIAVPTEEAFAAVPKETLAALAADKVELARVLMYHVVPAVITPDPAASGPAPTLEGSLLDIVFTKTSTTVGGAAVLTSPRATANGAFVAIDKVLLPPKK